MTVEARKIPWYAKAAGAVRTQLWSLAVGQACHGTAGLLPEHGDAAHGVPEDARDDRRDRITSPRSEDTVPLAVFRWPTRARRYLGRQPCEELAEQWHDLQPVGRRIPIYLLERIARCGSLLLAEQCWWDLPR